MGGLYRDSDLNCCTWPKFLCVLIYIIAVEIYSRKNINCSIEESLQRFQEVMDAAKESKIPVRG